MTRWGWNPQRPDNRDRLYQLEEHVLQPAQLPATADLWPNVPPIWNQGDLGSCTAHGVLRAYITEAIHHNIHLPDPPDGGAQLSRLAQYYDTRELNGTEHYDAGATVRDSIKALAKNGSVPETDWPYDTAKFAEEPPDDEAQRYMPVRYQAITIGPGAPIRTALAQGLAVVFGFSVPAMFTDGTWNPATQILPLPNRQQFVGGHCAALTGYDFTGPHPYFIVDNSFGPDWGGGWGGADCTGGRFALDYRWFDRHPALASDLWVIRETSA